VIRKDEEIAVDDPGFGLGNMTGWQGAVGGALTGLFGWVWNTDRRQGKIETAFIAAENLHGERHEAILGALSEIRQDVRELRARA